MAAKLVLIARRVAVALDGWAGNPRRAGETRETPGRADR
jgi:hypothetical protein